MNKQQGNLLYRYRHAWVLSYFFIYMVWFFELEGRSDVRYKPIHTRLDDLIPFEEIFIIPYLLWFAYVAGAVVWFFFTSREDFYKITALLFIGMTICLIIYTLWPNCQNLRPATFPRDNVFSRLVGLLYQSDTSTNVCPSIHVYNSLCVHIAIFRSRLREHKWLCRASFLLMVSICLSTVFLKQHSVFDGLCSLLLAMVMYVAVYVPDYSRMRKIHQLRKQLNQTT